MRIFSKIDDNLISPSSSVFSVNVTPLREQATLEHSTLATKPEIAYSLLSMPSVITCTI